MILIIDVLVGAIAIALGYLILVGLGKLVIKIAPKTFKYNMPGGSPFLAGSMTLAVTIFVVLVCGLVGDAFLYLLCGK